FPLVFFHATPPPATYPLSLHDALPISTMTLAPARPYLPKAAVGGIDDYHCFLLEPRLTQNAYVTSAVIKPQQAGIVHHVILFERSEEHTSELQSRGHLVCRLLLEKKKT